MQDPTGFTAFVPGFDFIKNLGQQASAGAASPAASAMPGMAWVAPTFDVEELDKRITELKSVQFWLEQNARALAATIQALEVQKMTLSTLKNMDVGMEDVAKAMQVNPSDLWSAWQTGGAPAQAPVAQAKPDTPKADQPGTAEAGDKAAVDPTQWWASVSQQFQDIAASAMQDISKATAQANAMAEASVKAAVKKPPAKKAPAKKTAAKKAVAKKASAKKAPVKRYS